MLNSHEPWEIPDAEFKADNFHYQFSKPYRLWFEYLRLSPSYWLAHKHYTAYKGGLSDVEKQNLPQDFDEVLKTYHHFGNVYQPLFRTWWINRGVHLFGAPSKPVSVQPLIKVLKPDLQTEQKCIKSVSRYLSQQSEFDGQHGFLMLAIPLTGKRSDLVKQTCQLILEEDIQPITRQNSILDSTDITYSLYGERFRYEAAHIGLRLLWTRAKERDLDPWQIGALARISMTHKFKDIFAPARDEYEKHNRIVLGTLTNRKLKTSIWVMENAARGKFSCHDAIDIPTMDYQYLWQNIRRRMQANEKRIASIRQLIADGHLWDLFHDYQDGFDHHVITKKVMNDDW